MVNVNSNDELLKKCSYVAISSYRRKVLETLKNDVKIPTKISEESGVGIKHVSNVLTDLKEHNLIVCINEDAHKGRLYRLTDEGKNVVSIYLDKDLNVEYGYYTTEAPACGHGAGYTEFYDFKDARDDDIIKEKIYSLLDSSGIWK